ncbi:putative ribonuclease H protein At1g65750 [Lotus japonicus]|uniref:putative ribonuclease H protein At1g65750 n=1 Tax=Lotus japonicus TaxID=34305 RepID=UPI00258B3CE7|nr:putative ribonuclease H protein At1g65750 [Lotus japonicus]
MQGATSSSTVVRDDVRQRLWSLKIVPRFRHFLWRVLKGIVPTRQRLWNKGVRCPLFCPRFDQAAESVEHALRDCPWSRRMWFASPLGFSWPADLSQSFGEWCCSLLLDAPQEVVEIFATVCYYIWRARNLLCFDEKESSEMGVVSLAMNTLHAYKETQQQMETHSTAPRDRSKQKWNAPPSYCVKVNVDASGSGSSWGLAVVIRNHFGNAIAAQHRPLLQIL